MTVTFPNFLFIWDFWNTVIAVVALIVSIYSIWYTHKNDSFKLQITNSYYELDGLLPPKINFEIFNNSIKAITIKGINIYDQDGNEIELLTEFKPDKYLEEYYESEQTNSEITGPFGITINPSVKIGSLSYSKYLHEQNPFTKPEIIPANDSAGYSYYINPMVTPLKIEIEADQRINKFRKTKSFIVHFDKLD